MSELTNTTTQSLRVHASCVAINGRGLLIFGQAGSGKSDLAIRMLALGAVLVADDQVELWADGSKLMARCPARIKGLIEARHMELLRLAAPKIADSAQIVGALYPADPATELERLPEPSYTDIAGLSVPRFTLPYFHASTEAKLVLWLGQSAEIYNDQSNISTK